MSHDTEMLLRDALRDAADGQAHHYEPVDTGQVLELGHRVVRRRRLAAGAGVLALATVAGTGVWALAPGSDRAAPVPATRTSTTGSTTTAELAVPVGGLRVAITVDPVGHLFRYAVRSPGSGGTAVPVMGALTMPVDGDALTYSVVDTPSGSVVVGALPERATAASAVWTGRGPVGGLRTAELRGTGQQAFVGWSGVAGRTALADVLWTDGREVLGGAGMPLPSASSAGRTGFLDATSQTVGLLSGGELVTRSLASARDANGLAVVSLERQTAAEEWTTTTFVALPPGSTLDRSTGGDTTGVSAPFGLGSSAGDGVFVDATASRPHAGVGLDSMTWTDATGRSHTTSLAGRG